MVVVDEGVHARSAVAVLQSAKMLMCSLFARVGAPGRMSAHGRQLRPVVQIGRSQSGRGNQLAGLRTFPGASEKSALIAQSLCSDGYPLTTRINTPYDHSP
jgi:hypothetical protein